MKKLLLTIWLVMSVFAVTCFAQDGVWKDDPDPAKATVSFYVQSYDTDPPSAVVVYSPEGVDFAAFLTSDISLGVDATDLGGQGHRLEMTFVDNDNATARLTLAGEAYSEYALFRTFVSNQGPQGPAGPQGPQGPKGDTGAQGPQGASPFGLNGNDVYYNAGNVGIGTSTPVVKMQVDGSLGINNGGDGNVLIYLGTDRHWQMRQLGSESNSALELASVGGGGNKNFVITTNGAVVVQPTDAGQDSTLVVNGNLEVTGEITGKSQFPQPDYDSGFFHVPTGSSATLTHNLGGNPDDYLVDLMFEDTQVNGYGVHNWRIGTNFTGDHYSGGYWRNLTSATIKVERGTDDTRAVRFRIRIWKY